MVSARSSRAIEEAMPVYKRGDKWRVVIWFKNRCQEFVLSGSKKEAEDFEAAKRVEMRSADPEALRREVPGFTDFVEGPYRTHAKAHLKARTWSNRVYTIATIEEHFQQTRLCDISLGSVEKYKERRIAQKIRASTVNDELKVLRAVLAYAGALGVPVAMLKIKDLPTRGIKRKVTFWTSEQCASLLASARVHAPEIEGLIAFLLNTGCRKGEALALEWRHVDLVRGFIYIEPSEEWQPKDGEAREIPISDGLRPYLVRRHKKDRHVFTSRKCKRFAFWPQRYFDLVRKKAKLTGGPHTTRHTYATHFLARRPDLYLLGKILGHSTSYVTELYGHLLPDHLERARNAVSFAGPEARSAKTGAA
jgi:integrase